MRKRDGLIKWLYLGIGVKRWLVLFSLGIFAISTGLAYAILKMQPTFTSNHLPFGGWLHVSVVIGVGICLISIAFRNLSRVFIAPYRPNRPGHIIDVVYTHSKRQKGVRVVAIGGGTGLPSVLRGLKAHTSNITSIVTVADDGGSSGRLRRELGVLPPGDLRNNIAALADDESLMTQLFQYRFPNGDLGGHAFGNLFISALAGVSGSVEAALIEAGQILNIQGRVFPSTLEDVQLTAMVKLPNQKDAVLIRGESKISEANGTIEQVALLPPDVTAFQESVQAIYDADIVVIGPGSLFTSILPNLLIKGIAETLSATTAYKIYVCNVATQPGETENLDVAGHVLALEKHIGRGIFQTVLANNAYPDLNAGPNTRYVQPVPKSHEILQRYDIRYFDLTDFRQPWRHDPHKLARAILAISHSERTGSKSANGVPAVDYSGFNV